MSRHVLVQLAILFVAGCGSQAKLAHESADFDGIEINLVGLVDKKASSTKRTTWKRSQLVPNTSTLMVGDEEQLPLRAMRATARIEGFRARVTLDLFFFNDTDRQLEGNFKVRLPNGATPIRMGFGGSSAEKPLSLDPEKWKAPKEARVVPRERAALAYGDTVRRGVDPALLEWSGAGVFSARVFPLEPKRMHRIVLGYEVNLLPIGDELEYRLDLPEEVPDLRVTVTVDHETRIEKRNPDERSLVVRVPAKQGLMMSGRDGTGEYFSTYFRPEVPPGARSSTRRAVFLVDVSLSSNPERFNVWLRLLRTILERNRDELREFAVVFFNIETFAWKRGFVPNTPADVEALLGYANQLALEGATDLGRALAAAREFDGDIFLLSDGSPTWGEDDLFALKPGRPLVAYATGFSGTDRRVLQHLARKSGGGVFSVVGESEVAAAAVAHRSRPWLLERVSIAGGSDLLLAGRPIQLYPGQRLWLAGRGKPGGDAEVTLTLRQGGKIIIVRTPIGRRVASDLAPGVYGQIAVGQLEELGYFA